ncbi:MAG: WxcM-like domain-containing protein [Candidatus Woesebacteria bacterium]|nr:WxcM-like domain-containing protein [Candidatus Woesebacteria bacterium]
MHKISKPNFIREDDRGTFAEFINGDLWKNFSYGKMRSGAVMGNHYHKKTTVLFYLISGSVQVDIFNVKENTLERINLKENEGVTLEPYFSHAIRFLQNGTFVMAKSLKYNNKKPDTFKLVVP